MANRFSTVFPTAPSWKSWRFCTAIFAAGGRRPDEHRLEPFHPVFFPRRRHSDRTGRLPADSGGWPDSRNQPVSFPDWPIATKGSGAGVPRLSPGLLISPWLYRLAAPLPEIRYGSHSWILLAIAGLLVGFGSRLGSGCTSGHSVCGLSRLSKRSLVATVLFMVSGALSVLLVRHWTGV